MKKYFMLMLAILFFNSTAQAFGYQYIEAADLMEDIANNRQGIILDIQSKDEFSSHHIDGAVATFAYPVKSKADKQKLAAVLALAKQNDEPVVIVCPRGKGGAKRTYDHLLEHGIKESRLFILEGGQADWPY